MFATKLAEERAKGIPEWRLLFKGTGKNAKITCADVEKIKRQIKYDPSGMSRAAFDLVKLYNITKLPVGTGPNGIILRADISKLI